MGYNVGANYAITSAIHRMGNNGGGNHRESGSNHYESGSNHYESGSNRHKRGGNQHKKDYDYYNSGWDDELIDVDSGPGEKFSTSSAEEKEDDTSVIGSCIEAPICEVKEHIDDKVVDTSKPAGVTSKGTDDNLRYAMQTILVGFFLTLLTILCMAFTLFKEPAPAEVVRITEPIETEAKYEDLVFSDVTPELWCYDKIVIFAEKGYVSGYEDGTFRPGQEITRAEFIKVVNNFMGFESVSTENGPFKDVAADDWFAPYVNTAFESGYIRGHEDGTFRPNEPIRRQEAIVILARILGIAEKPLAFDAPRGLVRYSDSAEIEVWARQAVNNYSMYGLLNGYDDGTLRILQNVTRAEAVELLNLVLEAVPFELETRKVVFLDVMPGDWYYHKIVDWAEKGYVSGYEDSTFRPGQEITRAEFVKVVNNFVGIESVSAENGPFKDVSAADWFAPYVNAAFENGYIRGHEDGTFKPNEPIRRQEAIVLLARILGIAEETLSFEASGGLAYYSDSAEVDEWARQAVNNYSVYGFINGYGDGTLRIKQNVTRAEAVALLNWVFSDVTLDHWCYDKIVKFKGNGYVNGYEDGTFRPGQEITRAEFVKVVNNFMGIEAVAAENSPFKDVSADDWFASDVNAAFEHGYIRGHEDGTFRPNDPIRRQEAIVLLARILGIAEEPLAFEVSGGLAYYSDSAEIDEWARQAVNNYSAYGFVNGYEDGTLRIKQNVTRAEAVALLNRVFSDVTLDHWCYAKIIKFKNNGYVDGYEDGTFRPGQEITRAEFVKIVNEFMGIENASAKNGPFKDVFATDWFAPYVNAAFENGYIRGYGDGTFRPNEPIQRQEAIVILAKLLGIAEEPLAFDAPRGLAHYTDSAEVEEWACQAVNNYSVRGFINGYEDGTLRVLQNVNRAELVALLDNLLETENFMFSDVTPELWCYDEIVEFAEKGYMTGYEDGTFQPGQLVTRAEFVKTVNMFMGIASASPEGGPFKDVSSDDWFAPYVNAAFKNGYIRGYGDGTFRPNEPVQRQEAIVIFAKLLGIAEESLSFEAPHGLAHYVDSAEVEEWACQAVNNYSVHGLVTGYEDGTLRVLQNVTRAELVMLLDRMQEAL